MAPLDPARDVSGPAPTLLTGATGFVGSAVARRLAARGHPLRLLVRRDSDRRNLAGVEAELVEGDLTDAASIGRAVAGCRYVFHVAADYRIWVPNPASMLGANVEGTRTVMRAAMAAGVERIVYCSSVAALGLNADGRPADETTPVTEADMIGVYKRSKFLAEQAVLELVRPGPAGGDRQSGRAGRAARHQADAHREDDPGCRARPDARLSSIPG